MNWSLRGKSQRILLAIVAVVMVSAAVLPACGEEEQSLTIYSGRSQSLVNPLLEQFAEDSGIQVRVKYGSSTDIASLISEEGDSTVADVVFMQSPGSLGSLSESGFLARLPDDLLSRVDSKFQSPRGEWIGTSGRARTVIYNTESINPDTDLPSSILDFTDPEWEGRIGWPPLNGSFQAFVTSLRVQLGEAATREWLEGIKANNPREYPNNLTTVAAAARGEIDVGFVNHYYLQRFLDEHGEGFGARNHYLGGGDPGALVLVAGAGILESSGNSEAAEEFIDYLLSETAQRYFADETNEYPLAAGVEPSGELPPLDSLDPPDVDLGSLSDLQGTLDLLRDTGVLP